MANKDSNQTRTLTAASASAELKDQKREVLTQITLKNKDKGVTAVYIIKGEEITKLIARSEVLLPENAQIATN